MLDPTRGLRLTAMRNHCRDLSVLLFSPRHITVPLILWSWTPNRPIRSLPIVALNGLLKSFPWLHLWCLYNRGGRQRNICRQLYRV
jgi:hypothetical protein